MKKGISFVISILSILLFSLLIGCQNNDENTLVVGLECNYSPFNWTEVKKNSNTLAISNVRGQYADGYDVSIAKYLADELDMKVKIVKIEWDALVPSLNSGMINVIIAGMSYTEDRDISIDFTSNYYTSEMTMIVRKSSILKDATALSDFSGFKVGSQRGTLTDDIIDQISNVNHVTPYDSFNIAALAVSSGYIDAMTAEYPVAVAITKADTSLTVVTFSLGSGFSGLNENELGVAIGIKEGDSFLQEKLNNALAKLSLEERRNMMNEAILRAPSAGE